MPFTLEDFVRESNLVEGILREPTQDEMSAHAAFMGLMGIGVSDMQDFVSIVAPGKPLRTLEGMNVRVGNHIAPSGGRKIKSSLEAILVAANANEGTPYAIHQLYETLHPFMDGNGRSGRVLWLWMMGGIERAPLGFLHHWYYQSLYGKRS